MWGWSEIQVHLVCIHQHGFPVKSLIVHICVCVHALLSYCPLHVPQLLPPWATDRQTDRQTARQTQHQRERAPVMVSGTFLFLTLLSPACAVLIMVGWLCCSTSCVLLPDPILMLHPIPVSTFFSLATGGRRVGGNCHTTSMSVEWSQTWSLAQARPLCFRTQSFPLFSCVYILRRSSPGMTHTAGCYTW